MSSPPILTQVASAFGFHDVLFQEVGFTGNYTMPPHAHAEAHLAFNLQGAVTSAWRKQTILTSPTTLTYIPPEEPHSTSFDAGVRVFQITLPTHRLDHMELFSALVDTPVVYANGLPVWIAMRLYREFLSRDSLTPLILEGLLLELLAHMARDTTYKPENRSPRWLGQARDFLYAHFRESLTVDAIATTVGVHPAHLTRAFRQHYHCTVGDYIRRLRVEYASHLLSTSTLPISCIAFDAGFADQSHFSRTFKSHTGMTPAEFQKATCRAGLRQEILP